MGILCDYLAGIDRQNYDLLTVAPVGSIFMFHGMVCDKCRMPSATETRNVDLEGLILPVEGLVEHIEEMTEFVKSHSKEFARRFIDDTSRSIIDRLEFPCQLIPHRQKLKQLKSRFEAFQLIEICHQLYCVRCVGLSEEGESDKRTSEEMSTFTQEDEKRLVEWSDRYLILVGALNEKPTVAGLFERADRGQDVHEMFHKSDGECIIAKSLSTGDLHWLMNFPDLSADLWLHALGCRPLGLRCREIENELVNLLPEEDRIFYEQVCILITYQASQFTSEFRGIDKPRKFLFVVRA